MRLTSTRAKSIGEVASPLLAGFSFTNVIVIIISTGTDFLLAGAAIISWTIASIAFIVAVQVAKYVAEGRVSYKVWTDLSYHLGVLTFLLGFGFGLAPQPSASEYVARWVASGVAFAAFVGNAIVDVRRTWPPEAEPGAAMLVEACGGKAEATALAARWTRKITARSARAVNARDVRAA